MEMGLGTVSSNYKYNPETMIGFMGVGGFMVGAVMVGETQIPIFVVEDCTPSLLFCIGINHRNQASYKGHDPVNNRILLEKPDEPLQKHLSTKSLVSSVKSSVVHVGSSVKPCITFLEPEFREVLNDIVTYVVDMNVKGLVLDDFNINNLKVVDGTVKFYGVGLVNSSNYPRPCGSDERKKNLQDVKRLLLKLIPLEATSPVEYKDFIKKLDAKFIGRREAEAIVHHFSLMSPSAIRHFFINIGDIPNDDDMQSVTRRAISKLDYVMVKDWDLKLDATGVQELKKYLTYEKGGKEKDDQKQTYVFRHKSQHLVAESLARFFRNVTVHGDVCVQRNENKIEKLQVLILNFFPEALFQLHEYICHHGEAGKWFK